MKTTMMFRTIANPQRTTLAHVTDGEEPGTGTPGERSDQPQTQHAAVLPARTANPRRTILLTVPGTSSGQPQEALAVGVPELPELSELPGLSGLPGPEWDDIEERARHATSAS